MRRDELNRKAYACLTRISPEAVGRAAKRSLEGCGIAAVVGGECGGHPRNGIICSI